MTPHSISDYAIELDQVKSAVDGTHEIHIHDFSRQVDHFSYSGWFTQQVLSLKVASIVHSDYYIVINSKNTFIRDIKADTFFTSCNQAKIFGNYRFEKLPEPHGAWYEKAAEFLNVSVPKVGYWPAALSPMVLHRQTALDLLTLIGEQPNSDTLCHGPLCEMLNQGTTEFALYVLYVYSNRNGHCLHSVEDAVSGQEVAVSLWQKLSWNLENCKNVADSTLKPFMFGAQTGSFDDVSAHKKGMARQCLVEIYKNAKLYDGLSMSPQHLMDCVA